MSYYNQETLGELERENMFKIPKCLAEHPAVLLIDDAKEGGAEDYKYEIVLKDGWEFTNYRAVHMGFFHNVKEFKLAKPERVTV